MLRVYARELRETLQLDDRKLDCLFPRLDSLLELHSHFLSRLRERRAESLQPGSDHNYAIDKISDILISQVHALNLVAYFLLHTCPVFPVSLFLSSPFCPMLPLFTFPVFCSMLPATSHYLPYISCFVLSHFFPKLPGLRFLSYSFCFKHPVVTLSPHISAFTKPNISCFLLPVVTLKLCSLYFLSFASCFAHPVITFSPHTSCCCHTSCFTLPALYTFSHFFPKLSISHFLLRHHACNAFLPHLPHNCCYFKGQIPTSRPTFPVVILLFFTFPLSLTASNTFSRFLLYISCFTHADFTLPALHFPHHVSCISLPATNILL